MEHKLHQAKVWTEQVVIPTYGIGKPDKNPMFLEKRVYQGSSGKVYPLPVVDKILDEKRDVAYEAVWLENEYIRVMVLPQLGGRIQRAYDKTNGYDFVYYNEVIKPALVGLAGPWISGGIEFNWPQHHRPTTYAPTDWRMLENADGSAAVELSEVDQMYGTKGKMRFTLYPGKAYIEIKAQLYNRTSLPQTFLWWANPAVAVNDNTQSVFPPDVNAVFDHGKRAVSTFPIAIGEYYKHDYGAGVDISRYKNIPVPTSYMCAHSDYNFVGGYDYGVDAGILHIADHHVSPGKKQWTWGNGDFGQAWDRNLTDANGPYIELMTGMYCDNQPDFTWLKPFEEKTFTQYFMPYKAAGYVKNASTEVVLGLEVCGDTQEDWTVLKDAYTIQGEGVSLSAQTVASRVGDSRGQTAESGKMILMLPEGSPAARTVLAGFATPILTGREQMGGRLNVEGMLEVTLLYMTDDSEVPVSISLEEPFRMTFAATPGSEDFLGLEASDIDVSAITSDRVEMKYILRLTMDGVDCRQSQWIADVQPKEEAEPMNGVALYFVQPGEGLWEIARRYRIPQEELTALNKDLEKQPPEPGQAVVVFRRMKEE